MQYDNAIYTATGIPNKASVAGGADVLAFLPIQFFNNISNIRIYSFTFRIENSKIMLIVVKYMILDAFFKIFKHISSKIMRPPSHKTQGIFI